MAKLRIGFKTSQTNVDWPTLLDTWLAADEMPVFDSAWVYDHFVAVGPVPGSSFEGWTILTALAAHTRRLQLGHLVLGNTYRDPALLARMAATLDHVSGGRFVLGIGAGWHEEESAMYGWRMPPPGERLSMLESALRVIRAIWDEPGGVTLDAPPYRLQDATGLPGPLTKGGPPIWLGTQGPRGLRMAARYADGWNHTGDIEAFAEKRDTLLRACEELARDPSDIEISAQIFLARHGGDHAALLETARRYVELGVEHIVLVAPAHEGAGGLRALASLVAEPLRDQFA